MELHDQAAAAVSIVAVIVRDALTPTSDYMRADLNMKSARNLFIADHPFMLDKGHDKIEPLGGHWFRAFKLNEVQSLEALIADSIAFCERLHVLVERNKNRIVRLGRHTN